MGSFQEPIVRSECTPFMFRISASVHACRKNASTYLLFELTNGICEVCVVYLKLSVTQRCHTADALSAMTLVEAKSAQTFTHLLSVRIETDRTRTDDSEAETHHVDGNGCMGTAAIHKMFDPRPHQRLPQSSIAHREETISAPHQQQPP